MRLAATLALASALTIACSVSSASPPPAPTANTAASSTRDQYRQRAQPLYDAVTADPYNFAGIYSTDEGGRWRIVVRYVGEAPPPPEITALVAADIPVDWVPARYSMARLNEVFGELRIVLASAISAKRVSQITPDEASNTVLVAFPREDPDLQTALTETYGDILSFKIVPIFEPIP